MLVENYYLNLDKIDKIETIEERNRIHEMYREMLFAQSESRGTMFKSFFQTLYNNGYLVDIRDDKIDKLLT